MVPNTVLATSQPSSTSIGKPLEVKAVSTERNWRPRRHPAGSSRPTSDPTTPNQASLRATVTGPTSPPTSYTPATPSCVSALRDSVRTKPPPQTQREAKVLPRRIDDCKHITNIESTHSSVLAVSFSGDGEALATVQQDAQCTCMRIWEVESGAVYGGYAALFKQEIQGDGRTWLMPGEVRVSFSPIDKHVVLASSNCAVGDVVAELWRWTEPTPTAPSTVTRLPSRQSLPPHFEDTLRFHPRRNLVAFKCGHAIRFWDPDRCAVVHEVPRHDRSPVSAVTSWTLFADDRIAVVEISDSVSLRQEPKHHLKVYQISTGNCLMTARLYGAVDSAILLQPTVADSSSTVALALRYSILSNRAKVAVHNATTGDLIDVRWINAGLTTSASPDAGTIATANKGPTGGGITLYAVETAMSSGPQMDRRAGMDDGDVGDGQETMGTWTIIPETEGAVTALEFPLGGRCVALVKRHVVELWQLPSPPQSPGRPISIVSP